VLVKEARVPREEECLRSRFRYRSLNVDLTDINSAHEHTVKVPVNAESAPIKQVSSGE